MPFILRNHKSFQLVNPKMGTKIIGLLEFQKSLELSYFSEVTIKTKRNQNLSFDLILDMNCSLGLLDVLGHSNKGIWGCYENSQSALCLSFKDLLDKNFGLDIDVQEITLYLNDTNIVIKNIAKHSIPKEFNNIITEIAKQYVSITKGLTEKPEEIFIPVFEDPIPMGNSGHIHTPEKSQTPSSYKEFWGIYLESEVDGLIFDVQNNKFIPANLDYCILDDNNN